MNEDAAKAIARIKESASKHTEDYVQVVAADLALALSAVGANADLLAIAKRRPPEAIMHCHRVNHLEGILKS